MKLTLSFLVIFFSLQLNSQSLLQKKAVVMWRVIESKHFNQIDCNDNFSEKVYDGVLEAADKYKLFFTQEDLKLLEVYRKTIDDELKNKSWGFTETLSKLYKKKLQFYGSFVAKALSKPQNFTTDDYFVYNDQQQWPQNIAEQTLRIDRYAKWLVLDELFDSYEDDSIPKNKATVLKGEAASRKLVAELLKKRNARILGSVEGVNEFIENCYLKTIAETADPHTEYLPPTEKDAFDNELSSEQSLFGFSMGVEDDGKAIISSVIPGSSAWKTGNIHENDVVLEIKASNGEAIKVSEENTTAINQIFKNKNNNQISLTIKSGDGGVKTVPLQRETIRNEENIVKGFVLSDTKKIGYIQLPSFYTEWSGTTKGTSCANDVAAEIVKLKAENIEGLILDLRYNGGGSVMEAVDLTGIFIDAGPVCVIREKNKNTYVIKDQNRGTIYDGPLAVMINGQSASASELVAGTLQDYKRAIIVGSNTFGKATAQDIFPIDTLAKENETETQQSKEFGYVKTTVGKLYRITGKTAQLNGVEPDIKIPDAFEAMDYTERSMKNALPSDTVMKKVYYMPLKETSTTLLAQNSANRLKSLPYFVGLSGYIKSTKAFNTEKKIPLKYETYDLWLNNLNTDALDSLFNINNTTASGFKILNSKFDLDYLKNNLYLQETNDYVLNELATDYYIKESYQILIDLISLPK